MESKLKASLFSLRITVFLVMAIWTADKFIRPEHAVAVYEHFYYLGGVAYSVMAIVALFEALIILGFLLGVKKRLTYGFVLVVHGISTLSSLQQYLQPFEKLNLLFFAAWPMWAACLTLFMFREEDTLMNLRPTKIGIFVGTGALRS